MKFWFLLTVAGLMLVSCKQESGTASAGREDSEVAALAPPVVTTAELLSESLLRDNLGLSEELALTRTVELSEQGVRYEWPLPHRETVERTNQELTLASLSTGQPVNLLPLSGRVTLSKRSDGLSLVDIRQSLNQIRGKNLYGSLNKTPHPVSVGARSGLWCPVGRVLYFDTARGPLTLGVELGVGESNDRAAAAHLAEMIMERSERDFLEEGPEPEEESWIQPRS